MSIIPNYPQSLLDQHSNWHMNPPSMGGRKIPAGQPGSGIEFLTFHRSFVAQFHAWYDTQPGANQAAVAPWNAVPSELKVPQTGWDASVAAEEQRIVTNTPPFASADDLGIFIENGIHNNWLHYAAGVVYNEHELWNPMTSPLSTYFYQLHGLVDHWWTQWQLGHKTRFKDIIDSKHHLKDITKEHVKELVKEHIKELAKEGIKDIVDGKHLLKEHPEKIIKDKDKEKDIFEGGLPPGGGGDPAFLNQLQQRVTALENLAAGGQAFIRPEERPDVGGGAMEEELGGEGGVEPAPGG